MRDANGPDSLAPGKVVAGRYRIEQVLGRGGMGEVYSAFDLLLREVVALKTLLGASAEEPHAIRALLTEARIGRSIGHPNVCRIHDVGTHEEPERRDAFFYFMTMELIGGERLTNRLRAGPLAWRDARAIARQILLGLQAVHAARVLHRDLKSDNVMLGRSGSRTRAVIMDFGLAYPLDAPRDAAHSDCAGSIAYMAPEQLEGRALGVQTDLFAFGVVLFEMLTGARPFSPDGDTLRDTARKRREDPPTAPSALCPELPAEFDQIVLTCLRPRVSERYPEAQHVLRALAATPS
jgi:serine/threonine-protein kinase